MELSDYLRILRRRWRWIAVPIVLGIAGAVALIGLSTPMYASSTRLFVSTSSQSSDLTEANQGNSLAIERVQSYANLVKTHSLAQRVSNRLGGAYGADGLVKRVSSSVVPNTVNLTITATDANRSAAKAIAQAYAVELSREVTRIEAPADGKPSPIRMSVVDDAQLPTSPVSPRKERDIALGLIVGLLIGIGLAVLRDRLDTSISSAEDLEEVTDVPLLGTVHVDTGAVHKPSAVALRESTPWAEAFRVLRTNMQFVDVDHSDRVFVISSSVPEEGKTTAAVSLAITMALAGQRVALVECDLRRPRIAERLGLDDAVGTTTVLIGQLSLDQALQKHPDTGLSVLTAGRRPPNPSELLQSRAMQELIRDLRSRFDVVLLDAPPLLPVTDAALLAAQSDGLMMVVRHGKTSRDQVRLGLQRVQAVDGECVGMVINMAPTSGRGYGYGYGYGYGGYEPDLARRGRRKKSSRGGSSHPKSTSDAPPHLAEAEAPIRAVPAHQKDEQAPRTASGSRHR
ncbi:MAG TPA: polysaccharide biosynthesis tyrosine autokinase [Nocardioides sp.]|uniref:polysaccharide biosynthesis tyrosine autokinase n=1 Tax=Nocardioides sp. TaxID=35761 RepID=UPI002E3233BF|nr:polysaccharide biosynthesis tyrosine autokinase [Nocardioides sp.]HEX3932482.1 polysaccharide biosynthesis tyrosine autokinase [Nocardioides sp.]